MIITKKDLLAKLFSASGVTSLARQFFTPHNNALPILAYHRVKSVAEDYPFDSELISATPKDFLWQMQHIKTRYDVLRLKDLADYFSGHLPWPKRPLVITFDDGFDDNYLNAFPVLKQLDIPATIFLATNYIGTETVYWFDLVVLCLKHLPRPLLLETATHKIQLDPQISLPKQQREFFQLLKSVSNETRLEILGQLFAAVELPSDDNLLRQSRAMSWEQVSEMSASGLVDFGSHTLTHPALNQLSDSALHQELQQSKLIIEKNTGKICDVMAYPFGGDDITTPQVLNAVQQTGFRLACVYQQNYSTRSPDNILKLERIHVETEINRARFAAMLAMPGIFA